MAGYDAKPPFPEVLTPWVGAHIIDPIQEIGPKVGGGNSLQDYSICMVHVRVYGFLFYLCAMKYLHMYCYNIGRVVLTDKFLEQSLFSNPMTDG